MKKISKLFVILLMLVYNISDIKAETINDNQAQDYTVYVHENDFSGAVVNDDFGVTYGRSIAYDKQATEENAPAIVKVSIPDECFTDYNIRSYRVFFAFANYDPVEIYLSHDDCKFYFRSAATNGQSVNTVFDKDKKEIHVYTKVSANEDKQAIIKYIDENGEPVNVGDVSFAPSFYKASSSLCSSYTLPIPESSTNGSTTNVNFGKAYLADYYDDRRASKQSAAYNISFNPGDQYNKDTSNNIVFGLDGKMYYSKYQKDMQTFAQHNEEVWSSINSKTRNNYDMSDNVLYIKVTNDTLSDVQYACIDASDEYVRNINVSLYDITNGESLVWTKPTTKGLMSINDIEDGHDYKLVCDDNMFEPHAYYFKVIDPKGIHPTYYLKDNPESEYHEVSGADMKLLFKESSPKKEITLFSVDATNGDKLNSEVSISKMDLKGDGESVINNDLDISDLGAKVSLEKGYTYKVDVKLAPEGYRTNVIMFTVYDDYIYLYNNGTSYVPNDNREVGYDGFKIYDNVISIPLFLDAYDCPTNIDLNFNKLDGDTGNRLAGGLFKLTNLTANHVIFDNVDCGADKPAVVTLNATKDYIYKFEEVKAPNGYESVKPITFKFNQEGLLEFQQDNKWISAQDYYKQYKITVNEASINMINYKKANTLELVKTDDSGNVLPGGEFRIKDEHGNAVKRVITNLSQATTVELQPGTYFVEEVKAPNGYDKIKQDIEIKLNDNGEYFVKDADGYQKLNNNILKVKNKAINKDAITINFKDSDDDTVDFGQYVITNLETKEQILVNNTKGSSKVHLEPGRYSIIATNGIPNNYTYQEGQFNVSDDYKIDGNDYYDYILIKDKGIPLMNYDWTQYWSMVDTEMIITDTTNNKEVYHFTSDGNNNYEYFSDYEIGRVYKASAGKIPEGYYLCHDLLFKVNTKKQVFINYGEGWVHVGNSFYYDHGVLIPPISWGRSHNQRAAGGGMMHPEAVVLVYNLIANKPLSVQIDKVDDYNKLLKDAQLEIYKGEEKVKEFTTSDSSYVFNNIELDTEYRLHERKTPEGYKKAEDIIFRVNKDSKLEIKNGDTWKQVDKVTMVDKKEVPLTPLEPAKKKVVIEKLASDTNKLLPDAKLEITSGEERVDAWTTNDQAHEIFLKPDSKKEYTLHEVEAPSGYQEAKDIIFRMNDNSKLEIKDGDSWKAIDKLIMLDKKKIPVTPLEPAKKKVVIEKLASDTNKLLSGAKLEITSGDQRIDSWTTEDKSHEIFLKPDSKKEYTLHEVEAPSGYQEAKNIIFRMNDNSKLEIKDGDSWKIIDKVTMVDKKEVPLTPLEPAKKKVVIEKLASDTNKLLSGAKLEITSGEEKVDAWITNDQAHEIFLKPNSKKEYILHEVEAPKGYQEAKDIIFRMNDNSKLEIKDGQEWKQVDKIAMVDKKEVPLTPLEPAKKKVVIEKLASDTNELLPDAKLEITNGEEKVDAWTTDDQAHEIFLKPDSKKEYTLHEVEAPKGYQEAKDIIFRMNDNSKLEIKDGQEWKQVDKLTMVDKKKIPLTPLEPAKKKVVIEKLASDTNKLLPDAKLEITSGDEKVDSWTTTDKSYEIFLKPDNRKEYTLHEVEAPKGYQEAKDIIFRINDNSKLEMKDGDSWKAIDKVMMVDEKKIPLTPLEPAKKKVVIEKLASDTNKLLSGADLMIINDDQQVVRWKSSNEVKVVELDVNKEYRLREVDAPNGYLKAKDIIFRINKNNLEVKNNNSWIKVNKITMIDQKVSIIEKGKQIINEIVDSGDFSNIVNILLLLIISLSFIIGLKVKYH